MESANEGTTVSDTSLQASEQVLNAYSSRQSSNLESVFSEGPGTGTDFDGSQFGGEETVGGDQQQSVTLASDVVNGSNGEIPASMTPQDLLMRHEESFRAQRKRQKKELLALLTDKARVPESAYKNSKKEELALDYSDNFNRQYTHLYPGRKELLLSPPNSFHVKKFICTTLRPTQLPYKELYDYRSCSKFVADYLTYEPLEPPHELPKIIPSPAHTLKLQSGNCFDFSIVLASFLQGAGYDAYVVSGYATKDVTLMDRSKKEVFDFQTLLPAKIPDIEDALAKATNTDPELVSKYKVKPPKQLKSQYIIRQEAKLEALKAKEEKELAEKLKKSLVSAAVEEEEDELKGLRIHSWVLILPGKRDIAEAFFIEPTTGDVYPTDHDYFLGVESVFSSTNYWVNMQVCYDGLKGISFDLSDTLKWEFVFFDNNKPGGIRYANGDKAGDAGSDDEDNGDIPGSEVLDMPPSWVEKLSISKEQFESKCPSGAKTVQYRNVKVEMFAEYCRPDGMILRLTHLEGHAKGQVNEYFENRKDKLRERVRVPENEEIHEFFNPGRVHGLKEHITVNGKTKEMQFYPSARSDGLYLRIETPNKIIEQFIEREDKLSYRSVTFEPFDAATEVSLDSGIVDHIIKATEKFERDFSMKSDNAAKRTYFFSEDKIRIIFHLEPGKMIPSYREYKRPAPDQKGHSIEVLGEFETNPIAKAPKKQHLFMQLNDLLKAEQNCIQAIKFSEKEVKDIQSARLLEESDVGLSISVYDTIRNNVKLPVDNEAQEHHKEEEELKHGQDIDYLSPFLINYANSKNLSKEDAIAVKDACLKSLKERLIEKASIIQNRLDEVTSEYQQRQVSYSKNADAMTAEETDDYVKFCNEALFKIHVLEKRLVKHKETAPEKYIDLDTRLKADPRLTLAFR